MRLKLLKESKMLGIVGANSEELFKDLNDDVHKILEMLDVQVFITSINALENPFSKGKEYKMFHVEHGMIKTVKS